MLKASVYFCHMVTRPTYQVCLEKVQWSGALAVEIAVPNIRLLQKRTYEISPAPVEVLRPTCRRSWRLLRTPWPKPGQIGLHLDARPTPYALSTLLALYWKKSNVNRLRVEISNRKMGAVWPKNQCKYSLTHINTTLSRKFECILPIQDWFLAFTTLPLE